MGRRCRQVAACRVHPRHHQVPPRRLGARPGEGEEERFEAAIDTGAGDIEIMVLPSRVLRGGRLRRGKGFVAQVSWYGEDDAVLGMVEVAIDAELYAEVEESCRASGSGHMQVAVIRRGAALTMRPYGPTNEEGDETVARGEKK
jgi:hypothetical protein